MDVETVQKALTKPGAPFCFSYPLITDVPCWKTCRAILRSCTPISVCWQESLSWIPLQYSPSPIDPKLCGVPSGHLSCSIVVVNMKPGYLSG